MTCMCKCVHLCISCIEYAKVSIYGKNNTPKSCNVIHEYHLYASDDSERDTLFIQYWFRLKYE